MTKKEKIEKAKALKMKIVYDYPCPGQIAAYNDDPAKMYIVNKKMFDLGFKFHASKKIFTLD